MTREEAIAELKAQEEHLRGMSIMGREAYYMAIEVLKQPEQKNGKKFIEIVTEYPAICTYPEYEGKPYFSIRYEENGEKIEGFGTYNPEVLSKYIREYFMGEKKGKWIDILVKTYKWMIRCDKCGHLRNMISTDGIYPQFCENCGAKMEGEE